MVKHAPENIDVPRALQIAILGEFNPEFPPHLATDSAILHSNQRLPFPVRTHWLSTQDIRIESLKEYAGIWVAPGSPYKDMDKTLSAIRYARENDVPCFGTCGGFQHIVIEYARNVLGYRDAQHAEYDPYASSLFVTPLSCSLAGLTMRVRLEPGSRAAEAYGAIDV